MPTTESFTQRERIALLSAPPEDAAIAADYACDLIRGIASGMRVVGLWLDPKLETGASSAPISERGYALMEESEREGRKPAAAMLRSGAFKAYSLAASPDCVEAGLDELLRLIGPDAPIVCVDASGRAGPRSGVALALGNSDNERAEAREAGAEADARVTWNGLRFDLPVGRLAFHGGRWLLRQAASAIILSGGKSTRIGSDKSLLEYRGRAMIAHIADQLAPMFDSVLVSANEPEKYGFLGLPIIKDIEPGKGPLMGIASSVLGSGAELCFVMGCDIPNVDYRFVNRMLGMAEGYDIVMPRGRDGLFEPLFAVYRRSVCETALGILEAGGRRIAELFGAVRVRYIDFDGGAWYKNINTMDDYLAISDGQS